VIAKRVILTIIVSMYLLCIQNAVWANGKLSISVIVAQDGSGNFKSIQDAISSLPDTSNVPRLVFIKKGVYNEKVFLSKHNVIIEGEDKLTTTIRQSIARDEWRCEHADDWGVATINISANDITFKNITILNDYGFESTDKKITCALDTAAGKERIVRKDGHQMALRTMNGATRMKAINCHFKAFGGDTVSPWDVENGMWYFKSCTMEGGVDFYCPRGWAWAEDCDFIAHTGSAAIWHDGSKHQDSKTVLLNCTFNGFDGFMLGRYHRDAQFFLINCVFAENMKDAPIYMVKTSNVIQWGHRVYYFNCKRKGGDDYKWYADNLPQHLNPKDINVQWAFSYKWNPEKE